jgi:uncharacterized membrane protein YeiH
MLILPTAVEVGAVVVGAISGAVHAVERKTDVVGTFIIALATGVGGGVLRDILIGAGPPVALRAPFYLPAVAVVALIALLFANWLSRMGAFLRSLDTLLLGLWVVMGAERALATGFRATPAIFLGTVTATGGGVMRDLLLGQAPTALRKGELYISAAFLGAVTYVFLVDGLGAASVVGEVATIAGTALIRHLALRWHITAPEPFDLPEWWRRRRSRRRGAEGRP